jgi:methionine synthase II (cobalamin-independent)
MAMIETQTAKGAHLVGGLKAPDAETAMRMAGRVLGRHLHAVTDGETGERSQWIWFQIGKLTSVDGIELIGTKHNPSGSADRETVYNPDYAEFPSLSVDPSVTELPRRSLGYADAAEQSYAIFKRLREEGALPADMKFQVSVATPYASVVTWVREENQERFFPVYATAIANEVAEIANSIEGRDLVIQYDVAVEIGVLTGAMAAAGGLAHKSFIIDSIKEACAYPVGDVERGIHLCYGDYKHRHFTVPKDLSLCVDVANGVGEAAQFVHMPADRETARNPSYFEPLRGLHSGPRLALGVIDYEGDEERTRELVAAAATGAKREFAVATECGMARIDERHADAPSLERLLELHARSAAPVR